MYRPKCLKVQIEATFLDQIKGIDLCIYTFNFLVHILIQMKDIAPQSIFKMLYINLYLDL